MSTVPTRTHTPVKKGLLERITDFFGLNVSSARTTTVNKRDSFVSGQPQSVNAIRSLSKYERGTVSKNTVGNRLDPQILSFLNDVSQNGLR